MRSRQLVFVEPEVNKKGRSRGAQHYGRLDLPFRRQARKMPPKPSRSYETDYRPARKMWDACGICGKQQKGRPKAAF